jgi:hypothetical protein
MPKSLRLPRTCIISTYVSTALCWAFFAFSVSWSFTQSIGLLRREISPSQGRYLHTGQHRHRINSQTCMPWVGFEPTIPVFERAKTVHALDRAATSIISLYIILLLMQLVFVFSLLPITVAAGSKAWNVFARSNTGVVGSNPTQGMRDCVLFCVCVYVVALLPRPRTPTDCLKLRNWSETKRFTDALCSKWEQHE